MMINFIQSGNTHLVGVSIIPTEYYIVLVVVVVNCYEYGVLRTISTSSIAVPTVVISTVSIRSSPYVVRSM